jgi:hypothetical protein
LYGIGESDRHATTISKLPDDVLLTIFDFYRKDQDYRERHSDGQKGSLKWHLLVHVCHRWRQIVFASPRRLNLQIPCTSRTPVKGYLGIWPTFPIVVVYEDRPDFTPVGEDNILAALRHTDRVCNVRFTTSSLQLGKMAAVMQQPFPVLTSLYIFSNYQDLPDLPAGFLGESAPSLQEISLSGVPYPALPTLLLSTSGLLNLFLFDIPSNGYISPEAIATSLAALPRLRMLIIAFRAGTSRPDRIRPPQPPVTRAALPSLIFFVFRGTSEYLECLVGRIDSPHLQHMSIICMHQLLRFQVPQLSKFIDRSVGPKLTKCKYAQVRFSLSLIAFKFCRRANGLDKDARFATTRIFYEVDWQVTPISQVLGDFPAALDNVVHLELKGDHVEDPPQGPQIDWSHLLYQFSAVKTLLVHRELAGHVDLALEYIMDEMVTEVLPSLELICLEGERVPLLDNFVAARRLSDRPVTTVNTIKEFRERREPYINE